MYNNVHCHFGVSPILWPSHIRRVFSFFCWRTMKSWCLLMETMSPSNSPTKVGYFWRWVSKVYIECRTSAGLSNYAILLAFLNSAVRHNCSAIWSLKWGCACRWFGCHLLFLLEPSGDCTSISCVCALANWNGWNTSWLRRSHEFFPSSRSRTVADASPDRPCFTEFWMAPWKDDFLRSSKRSICDVKSADFKSLDCASVVPTGDKWTTLAEVKKGATSMTVWSTCYQCAPRHVEQQALKMEFKFWHIISLFSFSAS